MRLTGLSENKGRWALGGALGVVVLAAALQGCGGGGGGPPVVCNTAPAVGATWTIDKRATGAELSCAQAAGDTVELTLNGTPFDFDCGAQQGLTTTLDPGNYDADFTLFDAGGNVLSMTPTMTVHVASCGVTDLGNVIFDVN